MKVSVLNTKTGKASDMHPRFAKVLTRIGRAQYLTRDMVAAPADSPAPAAAPVAPVAPAPAPVPSTVAADVDSAGQAWDEALHVSTKLKNSDGTWRKRPGARGAAE